MKRLLKNKERTNRFILKELRNNENKKETNYLEKANIIITGLLTFVSTILALLTYNQQQDIKGMSDLLYRQDILIKKQDKLFNGLSTLTIQNVGMIKQLKSSQEIMASQKQSIDDQIVIEKYSSKPIMNMNGFIFMKKIEIDTNDRRYTISIGFKNNGYRVAKNVKITATWIDITNKIITNTPKLVYIFPNDFQPSEVNHLDAIMNLSNNQLSKFYNLYFIVFIDYKDNLTNKNERHIIIGRQFKVDEEKVSYSFVTGGNLKLLEKFIDLSKI